MWKQLKNRQEGSNYSESSVPLGKVTIWLTASDTRWTIEIGDGTIIAAGVASDIHNAKHLALINCKKIINDSSRYLDSIIADDIG